MSNNLRRCLIFLLGTLIVWSGLGDAASTRAALANSLNLQVEPHFNGHFKFGEWLPLRVSLANDGPALHAEVRADTTDAGGQTIYLTPVELPSGARKRLTLYVQPPSFAKAIRVRVMDGASELASKSLPLTVERNTNYLVGVIAPRGESFAALNAMKLTPSPQQSFKGPSGSVEREVHALSISLADVPERAEGLRALDALIISGTDTSELTPEQTRALQLWVEGGGRLILGGGAGAARTLAGIPDALAQEWRGGRVSEINSLTALGQFTAEPVRVPGPFVIASPQGGRTLITQDDDSLLAEKRVGNGYVDYSALDLAASPFDAWAGALRFWELLLTPGSAYPANSPEDVSPRAMRLNQMANALQYLPSLDLPSIGSLAVLLAIYIVLVGPLNYLVLRRLRKLEWGWLTIPALTLFFSAGAFQLGASLRGSDVIINQISIINFQPSATTAPVQTLVGLFSPDRGAYTLDVRGGALVAPVNLEGNPFGGGGVVSGSGELAQGNPAQARNVQLNPGALQVFETESLAPAGWQIESALTLDGNRLRGTLTNKTSEPVQDIVLIGGNHFAQLDALAPGGSKTVNVELSTTEGPSFPFMLFDGRFNSSGASGPPRQDQMRQQILQGYFLAFNGPVQPPAQLMLLGWMQASPLDVQVANLRTMHNATTLVLAGLNVEYPHGPVQLTPGSLIPQLLESHGETGICGASNQFLVNNGSAVLKFQLPEGLSAFKVARLVLFIQNGTPPTVEVADRAGQWVKLDSPKVGRNDLSDPARFVSDDGVVRVRVSSTGGSGSECVRYDLELDGVNG